MSLLVKMVTLNIFEYFFASGSIFYVCALEVRLDLRTDGSICS